MHQPVTARQQRHERAEIGCLDDGSEEPLADLGQLRVGDGVDLVDRGLRRRRRWWRRRTRCRRPRSRSDAPVSSVIELIILPLGPMTSPILSTGTLMVVIARRVRAHLVGLVDGLGHHLEDGQPGVLGLRQRTGQHLRRDAVELGVQLQRGDEVLGACAP